MSTQPSIPDLQQQLDTFSKVGQAAASPFIHSASGQATEQRVVSLVNLGIAALPLLGSLLQNIGGLIHHAHAAMVTAATPPPTSVAASAPPVSSSTSTEHPKEIQQP